MKKVYIVRVDTFDEFFGKSVPCDFERECLEEEVLELAKEFKECIDVRRVVVVEKDTNKVVFDC